MKTVLLDTNAYRRFTEGDTAIRDTLGAARQVWFSTIVLGELHAGFEAGTRKERNRDILQAFLDQDHVAILPVAAETAEWFGQVWAAQRRQGQPLPVNDLWIAAQAMETGSVLLTFDVHFRQVAGLRIWPDPGVAS